MRHLTRSFTVLTYEITAAPGANSGDRPHLRVLQKIKLTSQVRHVGLGGRTWNIAENDSMKRAESRSDILPKAEAKAEVTFYRTSDTLRDSGKNRGSQALRSGSYLPLG